MKVPEIEKQPVAKGLAPDTANRLIMNVIEGETPPVGEPRRAKAVRLAISLFVCGSCLSLTYWLGGEESVVRSLFWLGPAILAIWIAELTDAEDSGVLAYAAMCGWALLSLVYRGIRAATIGFLLLFG